MNWPRNEERRPRRRDGAPEISLADGDTKSITALVPVQAGAGDACWRCGVPFAWTDLAALRRCTELARRHARPLRFEDIDLEAW